jgi:hypothetical protein
MVKSIDHRPRARFRANSSNFSARVTTSQRSWPSNGDFESHPQPHKSAHTTEQNGRIGKNPVAPKQRDQAAECRANQDSEPNSGSHGSLDRRSVHQFLWRAHPIRCITAMADITRIRFCAWLSSSRRPGTAPRPGRMAKAPAGAPTHILFRGRRHSGTEIL